MRPLNNNNRGHMLTDKVTKRESASTNEFDLADLDQLQRGLGDQIIEQLNLAQDFWSIRRSEDAVKNMLAALGLELKNVFVERGQDAGYDLQTIFESLHFNSMMQDRLSG